MQLYIKVAEGDAIHSKDLGSGVFLQIGTQGKVVGVVIEDFTHLIGSADTAINQAENERLKSYRSKRVK